MMNKKMISLITGAVMAMGVFAGCSSERNQETTASATTVAATVVAEEKVTASEDTATTMEEQIQTDMTDEGKTLVVYYSAQGHTVNFAEAIAEELNADLFEIVPAEIYTEADLDWRDRNSRVSKEHDDVSLRDIELTTTEVENWDAYDTVYIGYPIWWGIAAWPVDNFVKNNDFTGKTVIPFATSTSSGLGESGEILEGYAGTGNWLEGRRFQSNESVDNAKQWAASISK